MIDLDAVFALRKRYWENGYRPIEVYGPDESLDVTGEPLNKPGKQPKGHWTKYAAEDPPRAARLRPTADAPNTGIVTGELAAIDVDVLDPVMVDRVVDMIEIVCGETPLVRVGLAPKTLLVYRAEAPFAKVRTPEFLLNGGQKAQIEVLAEGQQFVSAGVHPDTHQPYCWRAETPADLRLTDLPAITVDHAKEIISRAEEMLRAAGAVPIKPERPKPVPAHNGTGSNFFAAVNSAALENLGAWVRAIFPQAKFQSRTGAWRVASRDLDRPLEEDLSIAPSGIRDWGEEIGQTAIDFVIRWGPAKDAIEAALWLCDRLHADPQELGYRPPRKAAETSPEAAGDGVRLEDFYAYMPAHNYIYAPSRETWPSSSVNSRLPPVDTGRTDDDGNPVKISAARWLDQNRPVEQMTWAPGLPMVVEGRLIDQGGWIERKGVSCFNLYRPPKIGRGDRTAAEPWIRHLHQVYRDDADHIICWLAHRVQHPEDKINHALVLGGKQGIGKDTLLEPVKRAIGAWNFADVSPPQVLGRFNGFVKSVILRISEARDLGDSDRYKFYEHLKGMIAAPPDVLRVDEKFVHEHYILNCCGVVITSNHKTDGIYLPADDRRHFVAWSDLDKTHFTEAYWNDLWGFYRKGGIEDVAAYLASVDLSSFNSKAPPPKTAAFWEIVDSARPPEDAELGDALDRLGRPDAVSLVDIAGVAASEFAAWLQDRKNSRLIPHRLEECGYVAIRNPHRDDGSWKFRGKSQVIYGLASLPLRDRIVAAQSLASLPRR